MADQRFIKVLNDVSITSTVDFTQSEPTGMAVGTSYINSVTGTGSTTTTQTFTKDYIYTYNSDGGWDEVVASRNIRPYNKQDAEYSVFTGLNWVNDIGLTDTSEGGRIEYVAASNPVATISHSSEFNFNGYGFTVMFTYNALSTTGVQYICSKETGGVGWGIYQEDNDLKFRYVNGASVVDAAGDDRTVI